MQTKFEPEEQNYVPGDKYKHHEYCRGTWTKRNCTVLGNYKKYILVQFKNYRETILKANLFTGAEKLERVN